MVTQSWVKNIFKKIWVTFFIQVVLIFKFHYQTIQKTLRMKKLLVILAIGAFAACNSATENTVDAAADSLKAAGEAVTEEVKATADSIGAKVDSAATKIDSTVKSTVDSLKK